MSRGGIATTLKTAGVPAEQADQIQGAVEHGSVLLAVHASASEVEPVRAALVSAAPRELGVANWDEGQ
jgi:hypothetical protein